MIFSDWPWRHWRQVREEAIALRFSGEQLNWREFCTRVDKLTSSFAVQGVIEGNGVMLRAWGTPQALLAWLALPQYRARVLPVNPQLPQPLLEELLPNLTLQFALVSEGESTFPASASLHIQLVEDTHTTAWQPTRLCSMALTSGSTDLSKAAVHTYQTYLASAKGVLSLIPFDDHDDWLLFLPLFHVSGQGITWHWLYAGTRMTVRDEQPLGQMLAGRTHASLMPTQLRRLLVNRSSVSLKAVLLGGAAILVELTEQTREQGIRCLCGYGLAGFASTVCAKETDSPADVGSPLPGRETKIVNDEVWLRAVSIVEGY